MRSSVVYNLCLLWTKMTCCMQFTCFIISIWLVLVLTTRSATTAEKLKFRNWFSPWHACCLLGYTRPREPTNERRSHQSAGFSIWVFINFPWVTPPDTHSGRGRPPPAPTPAWPLAWRGTQAPRCWDPNLGPPQLFSRGCAPGSMYRPRLQSSIYFQSSGPFYKPLQTDIFVDFCRRCWYLIFQYDKSTIRKFITPRI